MGPSVSPSGPAADVENRPIEALIPYARNARTHSDAQVAQIAASIREFGWTTRVLIDESGNIIAGHGRVLAARQLGFTEIPVMVARGWSESKRRAYCIADNKLPENASWDMSLLAAELRELDTGELDMSLLGFSDKELEKIQTWSGGDVEPGLTDPDAVPGVEPHAVSRLGERWRLGKHVLVCGDCTDVPTVQLLLGDVQPHLMVTDPPYGVNYDPAWRNRAFGEANRAIGKVNNDNRADWSEAWALFKGDVVYVWHSGTRAHIVAESLHAAGFEVRAQIIWAKQHFAISRGHYHPQHEPCWYAVRKGATGHWSGDRSQSTLWQINNGLSQGGPRKAEDTKTDHSTQKPVECMRRAMLNNSSVGQAVYEPFCGSGSSIIAAEQIGRACFAIEINPLYVDVAIKRWQAFTGKQATLESGETFEDASNERAQTTANVA